MKRQRGMGFAGVLVLLVGIIFLAIIGMKMVPAYLEFIAIKGGRGDHGASWSASFSWPSSG